MRWRFKSPESQLLAQSCVQAQIKENLKALRHWPLWGEFTGARWIPRTKASNADNVPFDDVIMRLNEAHHEWSHQFLVKAENYTTDQWPQNDGNSVKCDQNPIRPGEANNDFAHQI